MTGTLIRIALRNLLAHQVKSLIVGGILVAGTVLVLFGASALSSMDHAMSQSLTASISGHLQVSAKDAKDKFVLFPSPIDGTEVGEIQNFPKVREALEALPEVAAVVPQGFDYAILFGGNLLDVKLAKLRQFQRDSEVGSAPWLAAKDHVKRIVGLLSKDLGNLEAVLDSSDEGQETRAGIAQVRKAAEPDFWTDFDAKVEDKLVYLENKVARMAIGEDFVFLRYMGTDTARFRKEFSRFEMVDGQPVPDGKRGIMLNRFAYEERLKHKTARRMDKMRDRLAEGFTLAEDDQLQDWRRQNIKQYKELTWQLDRPAADKVQDILQKELGSDDGDLVTLVREFLSVNDSNFARRYQLFYAEIAEHLLLYKAKVGDVITIRGQGAGGYSKSANVKVYGIFQFRGLEKSMLAGFVNVVDMMTFRDLYGFMTAERIDEIKRLEKQVEVQEIERERAEDLFFGDDSAADEPSEAAAAVSPSDSSFDEFDKVDMKTGGKRWSDSILNHQYNQAEIDGGVVRNAAVILAPGVSESKGAEAVIRVASGLGLQVLNWRKASGMLGDLVSVIYIVLAVAVLGIYGVALFIINNSMVLATIERTREIGTLRAIGMQRRYVLWMFILESLVLGTVFGLIGAGLGSAVVAYVGDFGISAGGNPTVTFLFGGPKLYPSLEAWHMAGALALVALVTLLSTVYPAYLATRVTPLEAMQEADG